MGLLTDPRAGTGKLVKLLLKWEKSLSFLLYAGGIVWLLLLALPEFNDGTYFSENALLPGLLTKESVLEQSSKQFYHELLNEMERYPDSMPHAWLSAKFSQLHLDVYLHNFSLVYPFQKEKFTGQNVYGIVRAPRAASTEAIVVSVPFRPLNSIYLDTAPSIAMLFAFAKFCRKQKYWAKDIIFLITEHEQLGMQAWLDAYHEVTSGQDGVLAAGDLSGRAGPIQAAVNLELHSMKVSSIDVKIEGLNGQLPNLDLFNLAQNMIAKEGIRHSFQRRFDVNHKNKYKKWWYQCNTLMSAIATQATGIPTGNHGLFHRYGIEAITLEGFGKLNQQPEVNLFKVGRVVESIVRSLNNLLERFHQSYFFYLLPSTDRYISIGLYMRPLVLIISGVFIKAFCIWQKLQSQTTEDDSEKTEPHKVTEKARFDINKIASEILWTHALGTLIMFSPKMLTSVGTYMWNMRTEDSIYFGFAVIAVLTILSPILLRRSIKYEDMSLICVITSIELGTVLMCIAMHNYSLALLAAIAYAPVTLLISPKHCTRPRINSISYVLWILLHPCVAASITVLGYTYFNFVDETMLSILYRGYRATKQAFVFSITDSMIYGNWFYNVTVAVMLPIWMLFWNVICVDCNIKSTR